MEDVFYTLEEKSNTVRAYLPGGSVLEVWSQAGWVQWVLHPANALHYTRHEVEVSCSREQFAALHDAAQAELQKASEWALPPLPPDELPVGPYAVVAMVEPVFTLPLP